MLIFTGFWPKSSAFTSHVLMAASRCAHRVRLASRLCRRRMAWRALPPRQASTRDVRTRPPSAMSFALHVSSGMGDITEGIASARAIPRISLLGAARLIALGGEHGLSAVKGDRRAAAPTAVPRRASSRTSKSSSRRGNMAWFSGRRSAHYIR